jgi:hypothetical protein
VSVNDRLRVRIFAGTTASGPWNYGDLNYGDYDYGRIVNELFPDGQPMNCFITNMTIDTGRQRPLDQNKIGSCSLQVVVMNVPNEWVGEDPYATPEAIVIGRTIIIEALNSGHWDAVFTGTVESANAEYVGSGEFNAPYMRWELYALDALNRMARVVEAPGTTYRAEEKANARLEFITGRAALGVRYLSTTLPAAQVLAEEEFSQNLLNLAQNTIKYNYRLAAAQDGANVDVEDLHIGEPVVSPNYLFIASPHQLWQNAQIRMRLPCLTVGRVTWPMDRLLNQVTVITPDVPTDPTPDEWVQKDQVSIDTFGRRTYQDNLPMVEAVGTQTPALNLGNRILDAYSDPRPWVTQVEIDFTDVIDLDTEEPVWAGISYYGTYEVGFAFALRMLRGSRVLAMTLPPTDAGRLVDSTGWVLGIQWSINPTTVKATVYLEAIATRYGTVAIPDPPPPEPVHPSGNLGISLGANFSPVTVAPQLWFNVPATVTPTDVEMYMDFYDPGQGAAYFFRSPTTLNVPRLQAYTDVSAGRLRLEGTNATGTALLQISPPNYPPYLNRKVFYASVLGGNSQAQLLEPGETPAVTSMVVDTTISDDWIKPGNQFMVGWQGSTNQFRLRGYLFDLKIRKKSTGQVLLHVRPQDFQAGSWTDPYGNVINVSSSVNLEDDIPQWIMES